MSSVSSMVEVVEIIYSYMLNNNFRSKTLRVGEIYTFYHNEERSVTGVLKYIHAEDKLVVIISESSHDFEVINLTDVSKIVNAQ